jgi:hypothetical protein
METLDKIPHWQLVIAALCFVALVITIVTFFFNARRRAVIDAALCKPHSERLHMFDLAYGDTLTMRNQKSLAVPERLWTYDGDYLEQFAEAASAAQVPSGGTALNLYFGPTLNWDIVFAVSLALFVALFEFGAATLLTQPAAKGAMLFCAGMGIVYGAADVAEDIKLILILRDWHRLVIASAKNGGGAEAHIDPGEAAAANALTRIKFVTICLSALGGVVFGILSFVAKHIYG